MKKIAMHLGSLILSALLAGNALAKEELPDVTTDGLSRIEAKHVDAVYWADGATLEGYTKVGLLECSVAFRKDWMRDYNRDNLDLSNQVRPDDMQRIQDQLAEEFNKEFVKVLRDGGYEVVDNVDEDVLLIRPAIVNLDVAAPDLRNASMSRTFTASAGEMTLYMELYDSATNAKIGEVMDRQQARDTGHFQIADSVTNRSEARQILRKWANLLVKALDEANGK